MIDIVMKYAKDLCKGDKVPMYGRGWITIKSVKRVPHTSLTNISFSGDPVIHTYDSHYIFENVLVEL